MDYASCPGGRPTAPSRATALCCQQMTITPGWSRIRRRGWQQMSISDDTGLGQTQAVLPGGGEPAPGPRDRFHSALMRGPLQRDPQRPDPGTERVRPGQRRRDCVRVHERPESPLSSNTVLLMTSSTERGNVWSICPGMERTTINRRHPDPSYPEGSTPGRQPVLRRHRRQDPVHDRHHPALPDRVRRAKRLPCRGSR